MAGPWVVNVWWIPGGALALFGAVLLWWALRGDRSRGRKRCPRCWYDMSGSPTLTCSECGKVVKRERQLLKPRRRWRWAMLAIVPIAAAWPVLCMPRFATEGWWAFVPDRGLVWVWAFETGCDDKHLFIMQQRPSFGEDDWDAMIERCAIGDPWARPVSEEWKAKYGAIIRDFNMSNRARMGRRSDRTEELWASIPLQVHIGAPSEWPEGVPVHVLVQAGSWWRDMAFRSTMRITPRLEGAAIYRHSGDGYLVLPQLPAGHHTIVLDIDSQREDCREQESGSGPIEVLGHEERVIVIDVHGSLDDWLKPLASSKLDDAIRANLSPHFEPPQGDDHMNPAGTVLHLRAQLDEFSRPDLYGVAIGAVAELLLDNRVLASWQMWGRGGVSQWGGWDHRSSPVQYEIGAKETDLDLSRCVLRIRSDPGLALRVGGCTEYWVGDVTAPIQGESTLPARTTR